MVWEFFLLGTYTLKTWGLGQVSSFGRCILARQRSIPLLQDYEWSKREAWWQEVKIWIWYYVRHVDMIEIYNIYIYYIYKSTWRYQCHVRKHRKAFWIASSQTNVMIPMLSWMIMNIVVSSPQDTGSLTSNQYDDKMWILVPKNFQINDEATNLDSLC